MSTDLAGFIDHARRKGMDHATIRMLLLSSGWKEKDVIEALARTSLELPIPAPPDRGGAREAFLHLLTFAAFYTSVIAVVMLLFHYIEFLFPDAAVTGLSDTWRRTAIRWSLAFVMVAFPVFVWLSRVLLREMRTNPERAWSGTRRWLTFVTLFGASLALGGDLIALVFRLLEGELTTRFLLKVAVVLVVAGLSLAYFLLSLKLPVDRPKTTRVHRRFAGVASGAVLATIVAGFIITGSPATARQHRFDERRIEDLQTINDAIQDYALGESRFEPLAQRSIERPLPETLEQVRAGATRRRPDIRDPETDLPYRYEILGESRYRLCAEFRFERDEEHTPRWNHPAGEHCFELDLLAP
jgi:hypothetical protein